MEPRLIALLGAECTGKTTLAQALAQRLGVAWVPEYLRSFCDAKGRTPRHEEQAHIVQEQTRGELNALEQARQQGQAGHRILVAPPREAQGARRADGPFG